MSFEDRRMQMKQSVYKCLDCEAQSQVRGKEAVPYLIHRAGRGTVCPNCGSSHLQKISISMVMNRRWNDGVRKRLNSLKTPVFVQADAQT